jgi:hypothetical protein
VTDEGVVYALVHLLSLVVTHGDILEVQVGRLCGDRMQDAQEIRQVRSVSSKRHFFSLVKEQKE